MKLTYCGILNGIVFEGLDYFFCCYVDANYMPDEELKKLFTKIKNKINEIELYVFENKNEKSLRNITRNPEFFDKEDGLYFKDFFLGVGEIKDKTLSKKMKKVAEYINKFLKLTIKNCKEIDSYIMNEIDEYLKACNKFKNS